LHAVLSAVRALQTSANNELYIERIAVVFDLQPRTWIDQILCASPHRQHAGFWQFDFYREPTSFSTCSDVSEFAHMCCRSLETDQGGSLRIDQG
jgi:hypothetical protein